MFSGVAFLLPQRYSKMTDEKAAGSFSSQALEANLAMTRGSRIEIPEEHLRLLALVADRFGIHKRASQFFIELNHPYRNLQWIAERIKTVSVSDLPAYIAADESGDVVEVLTSVFRDLIYSDCDETIRGVFIQSSMQFLEELLSLGKDTDQVRGVISLIRDAFRDHRDTFIGCSGYLKHLEIPPKARKTPVLIQLVKDVIFATVDYWEDVCAKLCSINSELLVLDRTVLDELNTKAGTVFLEDVRERATKAQSWEELTSLPFSGDIALKLRDSAVLFEDPQQRIYYLIRLLQLKSMERILDHLLWDINRHVYKAFEPLDLQGRIDFLETFFSIFSGLDSHHTGTVLGCIETLGQVVTELAQESLTACFVDRIIDYGFVGSKGPVIGDQWQIESDPNHIRNIRVWMHLFELDPTGMKDVLAALVIHLRLGGIFIQDTDLFQKDVSRLLNADIGPHYKMVKHLAVLFPVYFCEVGAEGELREATTVLDELTSRRDLLTHFLRKQVHVESNNTHVDLAMHILEFWHSLDTSGIEKYLPEDVKIFLKGSSPLFEEVHYLVKTLCEKTSMSTSELLVSNVDPRKVLEKSVSPQEYSLGIRRIELLVRLCRLLMEKYSVHTDDVVPALQRSGVFSADEMERLQGQIKAAQYDSTLKTIYGFMQRLKNIILDPEPSEGWENIYYKRHIAAGIPSMYGVYREKKFEALGLTLRLEHAASRMLERVINSINLDYITIKTLRRIVVILRYFERGLKVRGIVSANFQSNVQMLSYSLKSGSFSLDQYLNIFTFFTRDIKEIINRYFIDLYDRPLEKILRKHYTVEDAPSGIAMKKETFYRELLASAFLIQMLDSFVSRIIDALNRMRSTFSNELRHRIMSYDPDIIISFIHGKSTRAENKVFLGAKAYYLRKMAQLGFPIPSGFVLTTELFRNRDCIMKHPAIEQEVDDMMRSGIARIEKNAGFILGSRVKPLLISVRSGTAFSMPGAMNTILNVGINREIAESMGADRVYAWAAWDCFRRLLQSWGMVKGIKRDSFDSLMNEMKQETGIEWKKNFSSEQMRTLACRYQTLLEDKGVNFPSDPFRQIKEAVLMTMESWSSDRAKFYRRHLQIADEWGTAVIVQSMVYGNLNERSGTGVLFTRDPLEGSDMIKPNGDYILRSQGEDVVSGLVHTLPVSSTQPHDRDTENSLQVKFPAVYEKLLGFSTDLIEKHGYPHQEIEFTFESSRRVYILQARPQVIHSREKMDVFDFTGAEPEPLGRGIGVGGGALNGIAVFDRKDIKKFTAEHPESGLVLLRPDTVPEDIELVYSCSGLLTSRGGITSHAAVTASQFGKVCVVNCRDLVVNEKEKKASLNGCVFSSGSRIAIDGNTGRIFQGNYPVRTAGVYNP